MRPTRIRDLKMKTEFSKSSRLMEAEDHSKNRASIKGKQFYRMFLLCFLVVFFYSCSITQKTMKEANVRVELNKSDFILSNQVSAEAVTVKVAGVDWKRLFRKKMGSVKSGADFINASFVPVIGNMIGDKTANFALYELMKNNPDYDVVFYPQYEITIFKPVLGIGFFAKITTVKATARLGKLKE